MRKTTPEQAMRPRYREIMDKHERAKQRSGIKPRNEYRIVTTDPGFDAHGKHCKQCDKIHITPSTHPYVHSTVPVEIGLKWATAHHIESIIEIRDIIIETKTGKTTVFQGTWVDPETLQVFSEWKPYNKITKTGQIIDL